VAHQLVERHADRGSRRGLAGDFGRFDVRELAVDAVDVLQERVGVVELPVLEQLAVRNALLVELLLELLGVAEARSDLLARERGNLLLQRGDLLLRLAPGIVEARLRDLGLVLRLALGQELAVRAALAAVCGVIVAASALASALPSAFAAAASSPLSAAVAVDASLPLSVASALTVSPVAASISSVAGGV
jgi:hypothetical protein